MSKQTNLAAFFKSSRKDNTEAPSIRDNDNNTIRTEEEEASLHSEVSTKLNIKSPDKQANSTPNRPEKREQMMAETANPFSYSTTSIDKQNTSTPKKLSTTLLANGQPSATFSSSSKQSKAGASIFQKEEQKTLERNTRSTGDLPPFDDFIDNLCSWREPSVYNYIPKIFLQPIYFP